MLNVVRILSEAATSFWRCAVFAQSQLASEPMLLMISENMFWALWKVALSFSALRMRSFSIFLTAALYIVTLRIRKPC